MSDHFNLPPLTAEEHAKLQKYVEEMEAITSLEPQKLAGDVWDAIEETIKATGEVPAEYRDRVSFEQQTDPDTGKTVYVYTDVAWEKWADEARHIEDKYHDVILKAVRRALSEEILDPEQATLKEFLMALLENGGFAASYPNEAITDDLFKNAYLPALNGSPVNELISVSTRGLQADSFTKNATITTKDGHKITIEHFDKLQGILSTPAKKIIDTALVYLANNNYYRGSSINPTVEIPLVEYGEACGYQLTPRDMATPEEQAEENKRVRDRVKDLKKTTRRELHDLSSVIWAGEEKKGRNKGDYKEMRLISSHGISKGLIRINFDVDAAKYFVNAYIMQYPTVLLKHDNHKPNAYAIGRKIAYHNGNDQNRAAGTENTLSVKKLLEAAPEIQTIEDLKARKQRNWKDKIKKPLEAALDENIKIEYLSKWEYRDPASGKRYTATTAQPMTWEQYSRLMVDFIVIDAPEQQERRAAKAEAARQAAAAKDQPKKKRGRPRKTK